MVYTFYFYPKKKKEKEKKGRLINWRGRFTKKKTARNENCSASAWRSWDQKQTKSSANSNLNRWRLSAPLSPSNPFTAQVSLSLSLSNMLLCFDQTQLLSLLILSLLELGNTPRKKKKRELGITAFIFLLSIPIYISFFISLKKTNT